MPKNKIKVLNRKSKIGDIVMNKLDCESIGLLLYFMDFEGSKSPMVFWLSGWRKGSTDWIHHNNALPVEIIEGSLEF